MFLILVAVGAGLCSAQTAGKKYYLDENFYGDQDFDMEDFDKEGFGGLDEAGNSFEEEKY